MEKLNSVVISKKRKLDLQNTEEKPAKRNRISESSSESNTSSDSEDSESYGFTDSDFEGGLPYTIAENKRGIVDKNVHLTCDIKIKPSAKINSLQKKIGYILNIPFFTGKDPNKINNTLKTIDQQAFGSTEASSHKEAQQRLKAVVGLNRPKSIRKKPNRLLEKAIIAQKDLATSFEREVFGFYWEPVWLDKNCKRVPLKKVRSWYKTAKNCLDKINLKHVKQKIKTEESKNNLSIIPYREIREYIKNSNETKNMVTKLRDTLPMADIYLGIFDADIKKVHASDGLGAFSHYDEILMTHKNKFDAPAIVASTGYLIPNDKPLLRLGVEIDLWVRHATAQYIKDGIYYPEPNTLILVDPKESTVTESFESNQKNYTSPQEMPTLLAKVKKRKLNHKDKEPRIVDPEKDFVFDAHGAIETAMPARMELTNQGTKKSFFGRYNTHGKIVRWTEKDLTSLTNISQSHYKNRAWAKQIIKSINLPTTFKDENFTFPKGKLSNILCSLLANLFKCYNPIKIAKINLDKDKPLTNQEAISSYINHLYEIVNNYEQLVPAEIPSRNKKGNARKNKQEIWNEIDNLTTSSDITSLLKKLIPADKVDNIQRAAEDCGREICGLLFTHLCLNYPELVSNLVDDYFLYMAEELDKEDLYYHEAEKEANYISFEDLCSAPDEKMSKAKYYLNVKGKFGMSALHYAAIAGNTAYVKQLLKLGADKNAKAMFGILPIHCAIQYCVEHDVDQELLTLLLDENILAYKDERGFSTLLVAIMECNVFISDSQRTGVQIPNFFKSQIFQNQKQKLYEYLAPFLNIYITQKGLNGIAKNELLSAIGAFTVYIDKKSKYYPLHAALGWRHPSNIEYFRYKPYAFYSKLLEFLIEQGANVNEVNELKDDDYLIDNNEYGPCIPLFLALENNDSSAVEILLANDSEVEDVWDVPIESDTKPRSPLLTAIQSEKSTIEETIAIVKLLLDYGADPEEGYLGEEPYCEDEEVSFWANSEEEYSREESNFENHESEIEDYIENFNVGCDDCCDGRLQIYYFLDRFKFKIFNQKNPQEESTIRLNNF